MKKIALVAQDLTIFSGVSTVTKFLRDVIEASSRYEVELISLATSALDQNSVRLVKPKTWTQGVTVSSHQTANLFFQHVGANLTEIEFFRYRPRQALDKVLKEFDLVQIVAGTPPITLAAGSFAGKVALQVATLTKIERVSVIAQTPQPKRLWLQAMTKLCTRLEQQAFERANVIFVENHWLKKYLSSEFSEKTILAPPGVDTVFFAPSGEYRANGYLLSVGRFSDSRKNVQLLFKAYRNLLDQMPNAPALVLAGQTAPTDEDLSVASDLKILDKIEILIDVSLEQLREIYQNAQLFILSSNEEGFGMVIAEAMACGLPVVATNCGGPEMLINNGETGFLTPVGDAPEMAQRIGDLLKNPEKRGAFAVAARKRAVEQFSLVAAGRIYLETYDQLLEK